MPAKGVPLERRRRELREDASLYPGLGTHYVMLEVGTPAQQMSVIVDTGSRLTAFPSVACSSCGSHAGFDPEASSSFSWVPRDDCHSGSFRNDRCSVTQSYAEGSSWSADQGSDVVRIGDVEMDLVFGCDTRETGLFVTQKADGIMGMSLRSDVLENLGDSHSFSLCFAADGGSMAFGEALEDRHDRDMAFTPLAPSTNGWYGVDLVDVEIGGRSVGAPRSAFSEGKGTIIDSGTTDTFLPATAAAAFKRTWRRVTGFDYDSGAYKDATLNFPNLTFVFADDVRVDVSPDAYVEADDDGFWPRVYLDEPVGAVLGANFMQDHDVFFDVDRGRVGIAPSLRCAEPIPDAVNTTLSAPSSSSSSQRHLHVVAGLVAGLVLVVAFARLLFSLCRPAPRGFHRHASTDYDLASKKPVPLLPGEDISPSA